LFVGFRPLGVDRIREGRACPRDIFGSGDRYCGGKCHRSDRPPKSSVTLTHSGPPKSGVQNSRSRFAGTRRLTDQRRRSSSPAPLTAFLVLALIGIVAEGNEAHVNVGARVTPDSRESVALGIAVLQSDLEVTDRALVHLPPVARYQLAERLRVG